MKKWIFISLIGLILAGLVGGFFLTHRFIDGEIVYYKTQELDLSGKKIQDIHKICELENLKELNVEGTGITIAQYETLRAAHPHCEIKWLVPFQTGYYAPDTQTLTIHTLSMEDVAVLNYLPLLSQVDATACRDYESLAALQQAKPGCRIDYTVDVGENAVDWETTALEITCGNPEEIDHTLSLLPKLESIRISGCQDVAALKALEEKYPHCLFDYDIPLGGQLYPKQTVSVTIVPSDIAQLEKVIGCFDSLADVTIAGDCPEAKALADAYPEIAFHFGFELLGKKVHTDQEFLDLSGMKLQDTQALDDAMPYFHNLKKVEMLDCGLDNETMGALNQRHGQTLFVWKVLIGERYYRTDIEYFYPTGSSLSMVNVDISNLQYCTELVVLDLGHFLIRDCSFVENMPKLEFLILAIGPLKDVRPIGTLKELRYLEIFSTQVTDYWPLINCTKLEALNIAFSGRGDVTPLLQMPWLTHLWLSCNEKTFTPEDQAILAEHLPNTLMVFSSGSSTNKGWRNTPGYYAMRDFLNDIYLIE